MKQLPRICPSCTSLMEVQKMHCPACETVVEGQYPLPILAQLTSEEQDFVLAFFKSSGSIKEMAAQRNISYPTMRNVIDDLIEKVKQLEMKNK